jgi:hypothetical protein
MFIRHHLILPLNTHQIELSLHEYYGMDPQVHLGHKYGSFLRSFALPAEPQVLNQCVAVNELRHF